MSEPMPTVFARDSKMKIAMLRELLVLTLLADFPTATDLARSIDPRKNVPRSTLAHRRSMIKELRRAGLITTMPVRALRFERLAITYNGRDLLEMLDWEAKQ